MEFEYSKTMEKLKKKKPSPIVHFILVVLMVIMVAGSVWGYWSEKNEISNKKENLQEFNPIGTDLSYSKLKPDFLSEAFASNYDESINYLFAIDKEYNSYIVAINADDMSQYKDLIEYTYSEDGTAPAAVTLQGIPRKVDDDMVEMAIESFNTFYDSDVVNETNFDSVLGAYYLDTTQELPGNFIFMNICIFMLVVLALIYILIMEKARKCAKIRKTTLDKFGDRAIWDVDNEISQTTTTYFKSQDLYITNNYIVSTVRGFDIIHLEEINHVYGSIYGKSQKSPKTAVTVVTNNGMKHEIAVMKLDQNGTALLDQIVNRIKSSLPDITYGFESGFYAINTSGNIIEEETEVGAELAKSNVLLGTIGAIIGAILGGIIWIIIGKLGFIAGLAGFAMMYFAIKGYSRLSGRLDKKGQIISLLIAFIMIFVANYTLYALEYCKSYFYGNYSIDNLISSYKHLAKYLTLADSWGPFMKDLLIGYGLSIWSGFGIIRAVFSRKK